MYGALTQRDQYNVLILGLDNAGKTTFLEQAKHQANPNYTMVPPQRILPTLGQNVATLEWAGVRLKFWDVGGQHALREMWAEYYPLAHGVVFVIDASDPERIAEWRESLMGLFANDAIEGAQILVVANKSDLPTAMDVVDLKQTLNPVLEHLNARDSRVMNISAATGEGLSQALDWISNRVVRNKQSRPPQKC